MRFILRPSHYFIFFFLLIYLSTVTVLLFLPLPHTIILLLFLAWASHFFWVLRRHGFLTSANAITQFWLNKGARWQLQTTQGKIVEADLCLDSICSLYFVLLNFKPINSRRRMSVLVFPDSLSTDDFRHLRALLRTGICLPE